MRYSFVMRTTLEIDDTVLRAARALADQRLISLGAAVSELALRGLRANGDGIPTAGFPVRAPRATDHVITDDLVAAHRDDD